MKYALTIPERYRIMQHLPQEGDRLTMHDVRDMFENLRPSEKERAKWGIVEQAGRVEWQPEANDETADIDFTTPQVAIVVAKLRELEGDKKLTVMDLDLYDKFVEEKNDGQTAR